MSDWSDLETELIVADYFSMLRDEIAGIPYRKTEHRIKITPLLNKRSEGSVEFKHQNISAVLARFGLPWIQGYKPRYNYQLVLEKTVSHYISHNLSLEKLFHEFAESVERNAIGSMPVFSDFIDQPPAPQIVNEPEPTYKGRLNVNYLELEQNNRILGTSGEELILQYEKWRLLDAGKNNLADKIEWIAQTKGDGLGYDILSKNVNGTDRFIEVKTTKLGKEAPIFFSKNEYQFSKANFNSYYLYRVFNFHKAPKLFMLNGKFDDFCKVQPTQFKGSF